MGYTLKKVTAKIILKNLAMVENRRTSAYKFVRDKRSKAWELVCFLEPFSISEDIALLTEVCNFCECFSMSLTVLESLSEVQVSTKYC